MIVEGPLLSEPAGATKRDSLYSVFKMVSTISFIDFVFEVVFVSTVNKNLKTFYTRVCVWHHLKIQSN